MSDDTKASKAKAQAEPELDTEAQGASAEQETRAVAAQADDASATGAEASRTGYANPGQRAGDECVCPDGRKGTVHSFDAGLICIPNHDQG